MTGRSSLGTALLGHASGELSSSPFPLLSPPPGIFQRPRHESVNSWPNLTNPATQNPLPNSSDMKLNPRKDEPTSKKPAVGSSGNPHSAAGGGRGAAEHTEAAELFTVMTTE